MGEMSNALQMRLSVRASGSLNTMSLKLMVVLDQVVPSPSTAGLLKLRAPP